MRYGPLRIQEFTLCLGMASVRWWFRNHWNIELPGCLDASKMAFIVIAAVSAIGIYLLNNIRRNVLINVGAGLWDTYNMATGLMGDLLSYLRLYALGLAGGMLGGVFNNLGMQLHDSMADFLWGIPGWICFGLLRFNLRIRTRTEHCSFLLERLCTLHPSYICRIFQEFRL